MIDVCSFITWRNRDLNNTRPEMITVLKDCCLHDTKASLFNNFIERRFSDLNVINLPFD